MSDSFNPQELLTKLRAKSSNSTAASTSVSISQDSQRRYSGSAEAEQKSIGANRVQATPNIRTPISLTLTPSQRQENLNARLELEREIKRLQDEVTNLMSENIQLKRDKEDVEQQFIEFKVKSEDTITKLRGKIAAISLTSTDGQADRGAGAGRLYGQRSSEGPNKLYNSNTRSPTASKTAQKQFGTPHSGFNDLPPPPPPPPLPQGGFRDPTFSELMRRSTPEHHDFRDALRRNGSTKLGTGLAANPLSASHPPSGGSSAHHHLPHHGSAVHGSGAHNSSVHGSGAHNSGVHGSGGSFGGGHGHVHYHGGQGINPALVHGGVGTPNANTNLSVHNNAPRSKSFSSASGGSGGSGAVGGTGGGAGNVNYNNNANNVQYLFSDALPAGSESKQQMGMNQHGDSGNNYHRAGPTSSLAEMESFMGSSANHMHTQQQNTQSSGQGGSSSGINKQAPPTSNAGPMEHMGGHHSSHHHGGPNGGYNAPRAVDEGGNYSDSDDLPVLEIDLSN